MKATKIFIALSLLAVVGLTSCRKQFAELNQNPTAVTLAEPSYLATRAMTLFETNDYTFWFYNQPLYAKWTQMGASGTFNEGTYGVPTGINRQTSYITMLTYRNDIDKYIEDFDHPESKAYSAMVGVLAVYGAIYAIDINGDIQYTEASQYRYGGALTPNYDKVEALYDLFVTELDQYIATFKDASQVVVAGQDIIYGGKMDKWAKLANTLKLKIAVRLYNQNASKAGQIASSVLSNSAGYIDSMEDAFIFHKADAATGGDLAYQTGNSYSGWIASSSENVINFMVNGRDPRVRFFYYKNGFNSKVIQEFIDEGKTEDLPPYVLANINLDEEGNFESYKLGEPWCRYFGIPIVWNMSPEYDQYLGVYFETTDRYQLTVGDAKKSYSWSSGLNEEMIRGRVDFTVPTIPGGPVITDTEDVPWWGLYLGAGETNLYLAELRQLGAISTGSAQAYYERGVELSVKEWDYVAAQNKIPYYGTTYGYDPLEESIELKDGEIEAMLATDAVKWDGSMEKIYLQQLMNFTMMPDEMFVTARRSGYPKVGSTLLPFVDFGSKFARTAIPRRFEFSEPTPTDIMHDIRVANLKDQGFTMGTNQSGTGFATTTVLNTERLWQDQNAPQWGEGK
ncbi:MAG: SusD/RagB family nutrient-binding outer membrane lipoprotein [Bacteroidales bacterium]|nr:SusD/RagB family nutrient-binding outer membrane lipoprotein [Bacteroidales bacterium]